jgi:iron complex transport system substrate-binding protein
MNGHPAPCRRQVWQRSLPLILIAILAITFLTVALLSAVALSGCGSSGTASTKAWVTVTDDDHNVVNIPKKPVRIVSTAPANTETLFALGVGNRVVGVTSLDDYPPEAAKIAKVGDFKLNTEAVVALNPDLVVGYSGNEEALAPLQKNNVPVIIFNPTNLDGIYANITTVGAATGATAKAAELVASIKARIKSISDAAAAASESPKVFYAVDNTLWTAGPGSFVDQLLTLAHATNVAATAGGAKAFYQFAPEQLVAADPDVILLPKSMYKTDADVAAFTKDPRFAGLSAVKNNRVVVIDDVVVTRPGPRIADGLQILADAIHPAP